MKTSVIITTYNRPNRLVKVLDGLEGQRRPPDEVVVADDGSGPDTAEAVAQFKNGRPPFELIHAWHEDRGFRAAEIRNKAILASSGDYIIAMDGDCIPERYFVFDHMALAQKGCFFQGKRVLVGRERSPAFTFRDMDSNIKRLGLLFSRNMENRHHLVRFPFYPATLSNSLSGVKTCNMGFFRTDILAVNGFNQDFVGWGREDSELVVRFFNYGLVKKEHPFLAICFHLWHEENDRSRLDRNDAYLKKAMESTNYVCKNGLVQQNELID